MKITSLDSIPSKQTDGSDAKGVEKQNFLEREDGSPAFAYHIFTIEPGGYQPYHTHTWEHLCFVISGQGTLIDVKGEEYPLKPRDCIFIDTEEKHQFLTPADATEPLVVIIINVYPTTTSPEEGRSWADVLSILG